MSKSFQPSQSELLAQLERIKKSQAIGRADRYQKLLIYLFEDALKNTERVNNESLKEINIAIDVFDKEADFDASDASIRVYVSKLRKKLKTYYETEGIDETFTVTIPTGSYRLAFQLKSEEKPITTEPSSFRINNIKRFIFVFTVLFIVLTAINVCLYQARVNDKRIDPTPHTLWQDLNNNGKKTLIVLGDRFVFWEQDKLTGDNRLIMNLKIHDKKDFRQYLNKYPQRYPISKELPGRFLEQSSAFALKYVITQFNSNQQFAFRLSSDLTADDMKMYNIVYIGGYHYLGKLKNFFQGSNFEMDSEHKLLIDKTTKQQYSSNGAYLREYTDHGLFAKYSGPNNNSFYLILGYSDSAILYIAKHLTNSDNLNKLNLNEFVENEYGSQFNNIELVYKISSIERTDILSEQIYAGAVNSKSIWQKKK